MVRSLRGSILPLKSRSYSEITSARRMCMSALSLLSDYRNDLRLIRDGDGGYGLVMSKRFPKADCVSPSGCRQLFSPIVRTTGPLRTLFLTQLGGGYYIMLDGLHRLP